MSSAPSKTPAPLLRLILPHLLLLLLSTFFLWTILVLGKLLLFFRPALTISWQRRLLRIWGASCCGILGLRVRMASEPPPPPFLLVCNHLSWTDILVLSSACGGNFLSKREVRRWPLVGLLAWSAGTLFLDRLRPTDLPRTLEGMRSRLTRGGGLIFFPEGTTNDGKALLPFKSALFQLPCDLEFPVHLACLRYGAPRGSVPDSSALSWTGNESFLAHFLRILGLRSFDAEIIFLGAAVRGKDRKELARICRERIEQALASLDQEESGRKRAPSIPR